LSPTISITEFDELMLKEALSLLSRGTERIFLLEMAKSQLQPVCGIHTL